ncbi:2-oxoglutarate and Fe(II)-dependent oxygenase domain-containing protein, putative [Theobroma cacao]|uniref:2-oxoglutarate and Fe(II)-dependent oxygenase domain-containing protein, putative n=1 Tax=Theobroma cacao TaxID=3641 RepID=A0A061FKB2_THECC|nr:2-oxoglutarate and Fe(II)-dependent oxygenase domain-containing protein, putative [Theobroma cacao]
MASSTHKQQQHLPNLYGATAAPPPTPSGQPNHHLVTSSATADALSKLLHRLPPTLSLPTHRSAPSTASPRTVSFSDPNLKDLLLSSGSKVGFFQLTSHDVSSQLANSAETESLSLFELPKEQKESCFPKNWPLGFDADEEEGGDEKGESFCLDATCSTELTNLSLSSLREFTRALEKLGLKIIDTLANAVGFENPIGEDPTRFCSLMWILEGLHGDDKPSGGFYPFVIGLQYQIRCQQYSLLSESGWVSVSPEVDSIMVTLGDIAQVWSNGKLRKVRGRPVAACLDDGNNSRHVSMSLLLTLPMDSQVAPLLTKVIADDENASDDEIRDDEIGTEGKKEGRLFRSFSFEDYAWRVYHECLLFKDPLDRYRI